MTAITYSVRCLLSRLLVHLFLAFVVHTGQRGAIDANRKREQCRDWDEKVRSTRRGWNPCGDPESLDSRSSLAAEWVPLTRAWVLTNVVWELMFDCCVWHCDGLLEAYALSCALPSQICSRSWVMETKVSCSTLRKLPLLEEETGNNLMGSKPASKHWSVSSNM